MTTPAARRYAEALLDAVWNDSPEAREGVAQELARLTAAIREVFDLRNALENPSYSSEERLRVLGAVMDRLELTDRVRSFARLVVQRGRAGELAGISETFLRLLNERSGRVKATVTSAHPLDEETAQAIRSALERRTGKSIELEVSVDPAVIGGVRAQVGTVIFDGTIRAELDRLRERLSES